jgi:hypothetical protein
MKMESLIWLDLIPSVNLKTQIKKYNNN